MGFPMRTRHLFICLVLLGVLNTVYAGFDEGFSAFQRGDFTTALREWRPLAEQGNAAAQSNLGLMYAQGQGVPQDFKEAIKWYRLAAEQGAALAQSNLGVLYADGYGVPQIEWWLMRFFAWRQHALPTALR
ncbi:putative beta-lactamase HcpD precursor [compost metagenome]